jgi:hypothetical protein
MEENYALSSFEWFQQIFDGRMDYAAATTTTVEELLGRRRSQATGDDESLENERNAVAMEGEQPEAALLTAVAPSYLSVAEWPG